MLQTRHLEPQAEPPHEPAVGVVSLQGSGVVTRVCSNIQMSLCAMGRPSLSRREKQAVTLVRTTAGNLPVAARIPWMSCASRLKGNI